jgi:hypothetical protein
MRWSAIRTGIIVFLLPFSGCADSHNDNQSVREPSLDEPNNQALRANVAQLESFIGCDLRNLDENSALQLKKALAAVLPKQTELEFLFSAKPWYLWRYEPPDKSSAFVLFAGQPIWSIPGISSAAIFFIDSSGKLVGSSAFSTGHRIDLESASFRYEPRLQGNRILNCGESRQDLREDVIIPAGLQAFATETPGTGSVLLENRQRQSPQRAGNFRPVAAA